MGHLLGVHWIPIHGRPTDLDYMRALQPPAVKIVNPDIQRISDVVTMAPNALVILRDHPLSEQHDDMRIAPEQTGKRHGEEWSHKIATLRNQAVERGLRWPKQLMVLGINEPRVWDMRDQAIRYTLAFLSECTRLGMRAGALNLAVGWPANNGPDTPVDWRPYASIETAIRNGNHVLMLHEYFDIQGPGNMWRWWAGRHEQCPWQVPIIIGECGVDRHVAQNYGNNFDIRGWRAHLSPEQYAAQLWDYEQRCRADGRILAVLPFTTDGAREWTSFDTEPAHAAILASIPQVAAKPTVDTHIPIVVTPRLGSGVTLDVLNVRLGPGTDYPAVEMLPVNTPITWDAVSGDPSDVGGTWLRIAPNKWVHGRYVGPKLPPVPQPPPTPVSPPTSPMTEEQAWQRVHTFTLRMEGGLSTDRNDPGNYKPDGTFVGTKYGISANAHPEEDIVNLTKEQALQIYHEQYWRATGISSLPWPLCLVAFEAAVNQGRSAAKYWLEESGGNLWRFMALRQRAYTKAGTWQRYGAAWMNRMAALMDEIAGG